MITSEFCFCTLLYFLAKFVSCGKLPGDLLNLSVSNISNISKILILELINMKTSLHSEIFNKSSMNFRGISLIISYLITLLIYSFRVDSLSRSGPAIFFSCCLIFPIIKKFAHFHAFFIFHISTLFSSSQFSHFHAVEFFTFFTLSQLCTFSCC